MMGGSGISWTICKSFPPYSRQVTTPAPHHSIFTSQMLFLTPNQQRHSNEGNYEIITIQYVHTTQCRARAKCTSQHKLIMPESCSTYSYQHTLTSMETVAKRTTSLTDSDAMSCCHGSDCSAHRRLCSADER